ncbi:CoA transferase, partial [Streptomyces sp. NPDC005708]|uniref:CoA transferase n=1 Tax=Streptomyces sp. NPDC005708 TaxID=3154564 RepID=UPI003410AC43
EKLHLDYEQVSSWNPRVIHADITGFGDSGPDAGQPGFDLTAYWSRSGLLASTRDAGARRPCRSGAAATTRRRSRSTRRS